MCEMLSVSDIANKLNRYKVNKELKLIWLEFNKIAKSFAVQKCMKRKHVFYYFGIYDKMS